jgi:predicted ribosome quality control (RQC) complex YloA/Tae2 family protein
VFLSNVSKLKIASSLADKIENSKEKIDEINGYIKNVREENISGSMKQIRKKRKQKQWQNL